MKTEKSGYQAKHAAGSSVDPEIEAAIRQKVHDNKVPCAAAAAIAATLSRSMLEIGVALDMLEITISQCQLGLFGYYPQKKIVTPASQVDPLLEKAIKNRVVNDLLSCADAWELAQTYDLSRITVASTCEAIGLKIKPCQLGAF